MSRTVAFQQVAARNIASASRQQLAYCGENSSGDPVFAVVYRSTNNLSLYARMFSVNRSTGAATTGTEYNFKTLTSPLSATSETITSERDHANIRQDLTVNDYVYIAYREIGGGGYNRAFVASYNVNDLTMSFGSEVTFSNALANIGTTRIAYIGSGKVMITGRGSTNGNFVLAYVLTRSGTSLTVGNSNLLANWGGWGQETLLGLKSSRALITGTGNNNDRVKFAAYQDLGSSPLSYITQDIQEQNEGETTGVSAHINATDTLVNLRIETAVSPTNTQIEGVIVTWSNPPTITRTNQIEWLSTASTRIGAVNAATDGSAYVYRRDSENNTNNIRFAKVTVSGTTLSKGDDFIVTVPSGSVYGDTLHNSIRLIKLSDDTVAMVSFMRNTGSGITGRGDIMVVLNPDQEPAVIEEGAAALSGAFTASSSALRNRFSGSVVVASASATVSADRTRDAESSVNAVSSSAATASRTRDNGGSISAESTVAALATRIFELAADFENLFSPGMTVNAVRNMTAIIDVVTDLSATANRTTDTGGLLEFLADLDAANDRLRDSITNIAAEFTSSTTESRTRELASSIDSEASFVVDAGRIKSSDISIASESSFVVDTDLIKSTTVSISSTASISATVTTIIDVDNKYIETGYIDPGYYEIVDFVIEEAEAHVTAEFAVSAVALRIQPGDAVFNAEFTAGSVAERIIQGSAQITAEFAVSALAVETDDFVIDISSTSNMTVSALRIQSGVVSAESLFSSAITAIVGASAEINISSNASVSADVGRRAGLSSNILSEAILLAEGSGTRTYSASIASESALVADVQVFSGIASTMDVETALAADANRTRDNETDIVAAAWVEAATEANYSATIAAITLFDVGVAAQASVDRGADLEVTADIIIGPTITARSQAALDALSNAEIANQRTRDNTVQGPAEFTQITLADRARDNAAALSADSAVSAAVLRIQPGTVAAESTAIVTIAADRIRGTSVEVNSNSSLGIQFTVIESAQVDIAAEFNASVSADRIRGVAATVTSTATVLAIPARTRSGSASLNSLFTVYADSRGLGITAERTYRVPAERRIYQIPQETRTWKVT